MRQNFSLPNDNGSWKRLCREWKRDKEDDRPVRSKEGTNERRQEKLSFSKEASQQQALSLSLSLSDCLHAL